MMIGGVDLQKLSLGALVGLMNELSAREDFLRSVKAELEGRIRDAEVEDAPLAKKSKKDNSAEGLSSSDVAAMTQSDEEEKTDQGKETEDGLFEIAGLCGDDERLLKLLEGDPL